MAFFTTGRKFVKYINLNKIYAFGSKTGQHFWVTMRLLILSAFVDLCLQILNSGQIVVETMNETSKFSCKCGSTNKNVSRECFPSPQCDITYSPLPGSHCILKKN